MEKTRLYLADLFNHSLYFRYSVEICVPPKSETSKNLAVSGVI